MLGAATPALEGVQVMRNTARNLLAGLALIGVLVAPLAASAVTYEDSFTNCNYPKTFDLMVMRPISLATTGVGALLWVPLGAMALVMVPEDFPEVTDNLIGKPARFTFRRRLGECRSVDLSL
jgi:hypothetical protein